LCKKTWDGRRGFADKKARVPSGCSAACLDLRLASRGFHKLS
jgi:hypothetical protein